MNLASVAPLLAGNVIGSESDEFVIAEWRDGGGTPEPARLIAPLHLHHDDDEAWYVLQGTLRIRKGDEEVEAKAGAAVFVPRGTPHTYWNPSSEPVHYLLVMTSNIYQLIRDIHALKERTPEALHEVFRRHRSELL